MNELSQGQRIKVPGSVVRSVSFEKIREGSLSSRNSVNRGPLKTKNNDSKQLYNRIIGKKLGDNSHINKRQVPQRSTVEQIKREMQEKQLKECTFKPKINTAVVERRTVQQFSEQQLAYKRNTEDKVKEMRDIIKNKVQKENTFQPNLHKKCQIQKRQRQQVHNRLYDDFRKRQETEEQKIEESQQKNPISKSKINTVSRNGSQKSITHGQFLSQFTNTPLGVSKFHENSSNRQQNIFQSKGLSRDNSNKSLKSKGLSITKNMNTRQICEAKLNRVTTKNKDQGKDKMKMQAQQQKNNELLIKKVLRQITYVLHELRNEDNQISYLQMGQILQKMNFIEQNNNLDERKHLYQIWQMLQGDTYQVISLTSLIKVIFCLIGCHDTKTIQYCLSHFNPFHNNHGNLKQQTQRKLVLSERDSKAIKNNFENLFLNRLNKGQFTIPAQTQQYSFKPFVSKQSTEMAEKYRQKILQQSQKLLNQNLIQYDVAEDGIVDHVDFLLLDDKRKQLKLKMMRQEHEREKKRLQDEAMNRSHQNQRQSTQQNGGSRCNQLYELGKNNLRSKRHEHTQQNQRVLEQCTFQPNLQKSRENSAKISSRDVSEIRGQGSIQVNSFRHPTQNIPDYDKSVYRMFEARQRRRQNSQKSSNNQPMKSNRDDMSPLLYLNVNMQGSQDVKIPVYNCDTMKSITYKVRILMGMQACEQEKLQSIIKEQIIPALQSMGFN